MKLAMTAIDQIGTQDGREMIINGLLSALRVDATMSASPCLPLLSAQRHILCSAQSSRVGASFAGQVAAETLGPSPGVPERGALLLLLLVFLQPHAHGAIAGSRHRAQTR
jgi:hypothetical protein